MYSFMYLFALFVYNVMHLYVTTLYRGIKNIYIYIYIYPALTVIKTASTGQVRSECTFRASCCSARLSRVLLYAPSHRQDSTYHGLCYTSRGALAGTRNSSMGSPP